MSANLESTAERPENRLVVYGVWLVLVVMIGMTVPLLFSGLHISVWRHDSLFYTENFTDKLTTEGRWIVYLCFDRLKTMNGNLVWLANVLVHFAFMFTVASKVTRRRTFAAVLGLTAMQFIPVYSQAMWPLYLFPATLSLGLAILVHNRMPVWLFFLVFGMLFHGSMQQYYFLLPLLYVSEVGAEPRGAMRHVWLLLAKWIAGFVFGYAVSMLMLGAITGGFFIDVADWRNPHPITNFQDLLANLARSFDQLLTFLWVVAPGILVVISLCLAFVINMYRRPVWTAVAPVVIGACVTLAHYAMVVPIGVSISGRSVIATCAGIFVVVFVQGPVRGWKLLCLSLCALTVFISYRDLNEKNIDWYATVTDAFRDDLVALKATCPPEVHGLVVIDGTAWSYQKRVERQNSLVKPFFWESLLSRRVSPDYRWRAPVLEAGFSEVHFCRVERPWCAHNLQYDTPGVCESSVPNISVHGTSNGGYLVVSLRD